MASKAYQIITDRILEKLRDGVVPWHRPWGRPETMPQNFHSGKTYRGMNVFMLACQGHDSPYWLTYKQAKGRGGCVRAGERGSPVVWWQWFEKKDEDTGKKKRIPFLKHYTVFNASQIDGIEFPLPPQPNPGFEPIKACEGIRDSYAGSPPIRHQGHQAMYSPGEDRITMPAPEWFEGSEEYYNTLFHELTHSTGHKSRLDRTGVTDVKRFGSKSYSREELVAEMGAAFLSGRAGIGLKTLDNSASYIQNWIGKLKGDPKLVVTAAAQAQRASDHILGIKWKD